MAHAARYGPAQIAEFPYNDCSTLPTDKYSNWRDKMELPGCNVAADERSTRHFRNLLDDVSVLTDSLAEART